MMERGGQMWDRQALPSVVAPLRKRSPESLDLADCESDFNTLGGATFFGCGETGKKGAWWISRCVLTEALRRNEVAFMTRLASPAPGFHGSPLPHLPFPHTWDSSREHLQMGELRKAKPPLGPISPRKLVGSQPAGSRLMEAGLYLV